MINCKLAKWIFIRRTFSLFVTGRLFIYLKRFSDEYYLAQHLISITDCFVPVRVFGCTSPTFQEFVPMDTQLQFGSSRDHARLLLESVCKLRDIAERVVFRATSYASDMLQLGKELGYTDTIIHCLLKIRVSLDSSLFN